MKQPALSLLLTEYSMIPLSGVWPFTCSTCKQQVAALSFPMQVSQVGQKKNCTEESKLQMASLTLRIKHSRYA